jgi:L-aminopeptidase/D-esterase-like protein
VPIVCGAILFDLALGDPCVRPDAKAGYEAIRSASRGRVAEGSVGAGAGATVGKMMGMERAMRGGLGSWAISVPGGLIVGAIAVVNAIGNVVDPKTGSVIAGVRRKDGKGFVDVMGEIHKGYRMRSPFKGNTVLGLVATNAPLRKSECTKVAQMAHDGLARTICPSHMPWDGDTVFAVSTGSGRGRRNEDAGIIGALAAEALAVAVVRGVSQATTWGIYPSVSEFGSGR